MIPLRQALDDYLRIRRGLGFKLQGDERILESFVDFLEQAGAERITIELALRWARMPINAHPHRWRQRLGIVRGFAGHVALIEAAGALEPPLRAATFRTVIGLMATTGLRLGEALWLDRADVDLADGALHVRARLHKQREVPLHPSTTRALRDYARLRDRRWLRPQSPGFFLNTRGGRLSKPEFNHWFAKLIGQIGLEGAGERVRPRPHDLRHTMAVRTLLDWHHAGEDVDRRMPELSTILGHADPASTYWYLEAVPELMALISRRLERVPEVLS
ncbi:MAG: tyrosine-type recombinase/integrase [Actinobacteria bacterium]|nr:tyrosine-type recombinase/integrase [Actinomycetota bacterium]